MRKGMGEVRGTGVVRIGEDGRRPAMSTCPRAAWARAAPGSQRADFGWAKVLACSVQWGKAIRHGVKGWSREERGGAWVCVIG